MDRLPAQAAVRTVHIRLARAPAAVLRRALAALARGLGSWTLSSAWAASKRCPDRGVEAGRGVAVHIEPPVAHELVLGEHRAVGAEEGGPGVAARVQAHVEHLAPLRRVRVVAAGHAVAAREGGGGVRGGEHGVVQAGLPGHRAAQVSGAGADQEGEEETWGRVATLATRDGGTRKPVSDV